MWCYLYHSTLELIMSSIFLINSMIELFFLKQYPWRITQTKCCEGSCLKSVVGNDPDHILLWILTRHQWLWAEPHWGSEFIRKHFSWGMVCFPTEEELRCVKFFFFCLIHGVVTLPVGWKQVYKSGVKIVSYYIKEHPYTPLRKIRNSPQIDSQSALHKEKEMRVSENKSEHENPH